MLIHREIEAWRGTVFMAECTTPAGRNGDHLQLSHTITHVRLSRPVSHGNRTQALPIGMWWPYQFGMFSLFCKVDCLQWNDSKRTWKIPGFTVVWHQLGYSKFSAFWDGCDWFSLYIMVFMFNARIIISQGPRVFVENQWKVIYLSL